MLTDASILFSRCLKRMFNQFFVRNFKRNGDHLNLGVEVRIDEICARVPTRRMSCSTV